MRFMQFRNAALALSLLGVAGFAVDVTMPIASAQSNISGDIAGTV